MAGTDASWRQLCTLFISEIQLSSQPAVILANGQSPCMRTITRSAATSFVDRWASRWYSLSNALIVRMRPSGWCLEGKMPRFSNASSRWAYSSPPCRGESHIDRFFQQAGFFEYVFPGAVSANSLTSVYISPARHLGMIRLQCRE